MPYMPPLPLIESVPAMKDWTELSLPYGTTELRRVRLPQLVRLYAYGCPLTTLPWSDLSKIGDISLGDLELDTLDVWQLPLLEYCAISYCSPLTTIDAHGLDVLAYFTIESCNNIESIDLSGCPNLTNVALYYSGHPAAVVDQVLADLVANGATNGYFYSYSNAAPSNPTGQGYVTILASRGWYVYSY